MTWRLALLASAAVLAACSERRVADPVQFTVLRASLPEDGAPPLLLNDAITVFFSAPLDPMSVTPDTVAVYDDQGHPVRARLRVGATWVTLLPEPPLTPSLDDGSLRPDRTYRLVVAGYPRPDAVRAGDGRRLSGMFHRTFRTAAADGAPLGLPAPLRPIAGGTLPFVLRPQPAPGRLPVDDPRLRLSCTTPVLPTSLRPEAFEIFLVRMSQPLPSAANPALRIAPRTVRLLPAQVGDEQPGCTIEIDLGLRVRLLEQAERLALMPGDWIGVKAAAGRYSLRDYAGQPLQVAELEMQSWLAVPGTRAAVLEWNRDEPWLPVADLAIPGFEWSRDGMLRPHVRVEGGDGSLGLFRPSRDLRLVPGQPFDRGDGTMVVDRDGIYPFAAIEVPAGVTVEIEPLGGRAVLLASGRARIAGRLLVPAVGPPAALRVGDLVDLGSLTANAAVTLLAAGGVAVEGAVERVAGVGDGVVFALVSGGPVRLLGPIPLGSLLATEPGETAVDGLAQRVTAVRIRLTPGLPADAEVSAVGLSHYQPLPPDWTTGALRLLECDPRLRVEWQTAPADPVRGGPDEDPARAGPPREVDEQGVFTASPGSFLRLRCTALLRGGDPLPGLGGVRVFER